MPALAARIGLTDVNDEFGYVISNELDCIPDSLDKLFWTTWPKGQSGWRQLTPGVGRAYKTSRTRTEGEHAQIQR